MRRQISHYDRRGFTLTEIAIVLAVAGIIIGGIFALAGLANRRVEMNQALDEINMIAANMRSLYAGQNISSPLFVTQSPLTATPKLITQGVFPSEMLSPAPPAGQIPAAGTVANNPWSSPAGGSAFVGLQAGGGGAPAQFNIEFQNVPAAPCADLLVRNSLPGDSHLMEITVSSGLTFLGSGNQLPVSPSQALLACPSSGTYTIDWFYKLGD